MKILWIAAGGALGAVARYALSGVVQRWGGESFPWGTVAVNILGCLIFGFIWAVAVEHFNVSGEVRFVVLVGFLGSFTTFSTFAFETIQLARDSEWLLAGANIVIQNTVGLLAMFLGWTLGRLV